MCKILAFQQRVILSHLSWDKNFCVISTFWSTLIVELKWIDWVTRFPILSNFEGERKNFSDWKRKIQKQKVHFLWLHRKSFPSYHNSKNHEQTINLVLRTCWRISLKFFLSVSSSVWLRKNKKEEISWKCEIERNKTKVLLFLSNLDFYINFHELYCISWDLKFRCW